MRLTFAGRLYRAPRDARSQRTRSFRAIVDWAPGKWERGASGYVHFGNRSSSSQEKKTWLRKNLVVNCACVTLKQRKNGFLKVKANLR
jgi:hypothetical protein